MPEAPLPCFYDDGMSDEIADLRQVLVSHGVPEEVVTRCANEEDATDALVAYMLLGAMPFQTAAELADRAGTTEDTVRRVWSLAGFPVAGSEGAFRPSDVDIVNAFVLGSEFFGVDAMEHFTRALGSATRTIAETAVALFFERFADHDFQSSSERLDVIADALALFPLVPDSVARLIARHFEAAQRFLSPVRREFDDPRVELTVGFCDLVGSTRLANAVDPTELARTLTAYELAATAIAVEHGGRIVKFIGDEAMFTARETAQACDIATSLIAWAEADPVLEGARAGVAHGIVLPRDGDLFGPPVNLAAHLAAIAPDGSILVADDAGPDAREIRGFTEPVPTRTILPTH
jgi:adenylate cyclase